jgi:cytochrome c-type biogenesis protein CcmH
MTFWIVTTLLALSLAALIALALLRVRAGGEPAAAYDLKVYRQQLREVEKDLARGLINAGDADRTRTEISRRILSADAALQAEASGAAQPRGLTRAAAMACALLLTGGGALLYLQLGAPGYGDLPLDYRFELAAQAAQERPTQSEAEAHVPPSPPIEVDESYGQLIEKLRQATAERNDDAEGFALLARHEAALRNFQAAYTAKLRYIELRAGDLEAFDHGEAAELMIMAANGYVSPEAEEQLNRALARDPGHGPSRYYWGVMQEQLGRPDLTFRVWRETLDMGPADAPWNMAIAEQIQDVAWRAGINYEPPASAPPSAAAPALAGPSAEDMEAASELDAGDRQEMIRGMVEGLAERLATEGGSAAEWAQLISALTVLGEAGRAMTILGEAQEKFAADPEALKTVEAAARDAGILQ